LIWHGAAAPKTESDNVYAIKKDGSATVFVRIITACTPSVEYEYAQALNASLRVFFRRQRIGSGSFFVLTTMGGATPPGD